MYAAVSGLLSVLSRVEDGVTCSAELSAPNRERSNDAASDPLSAEHLSSATRAAKQARTGTGEDHGSYLSFSLLLTWPLAPAVAKGVKGEESWDDLVMLPPGGPSPGFKENSVG